jgi:tetratricopeptide (TPR) repeat protein
MASYFSEPHHIELFSLGFDLIRDQLPETMIEDIITEIEENLEEYPDDRSSVLALDSLYDAIDDRDCAIGTDSGYTCLTYSSIITLREARHQMLNGDLKEAERLLEEVIRLDSADSLVRQLCALIAYGRRNDREKFTSTWKQLHMQYGAEVHVSVKDHIGLQIDYALFPDLPFREHIEGIGFLFAFDINQGRETEIVALITGFRDYLNNLLKNTIEEAVVDGFTDSLPAFGVIAAISSGMVKAAEDLMKTGDSINGAVMSETIQPALDGIRRTGREMLVLETLKHWSFNRVKPTPDLIHTLQEQSGGDDQLIIEMIHLLDIERPRGGYEKIRSMLPVSRMEETAPLKKELVHMVSECRFDEALAFAEKHALFPKGSEKLEDLIANALLNSGREIEAFEYLLGCMKNGHLLEQYTSLFELACALNRMDELPELRPVLESKHIFSAMFLLDAYGQLSKKDVKGCLALIKRAEGSGLCADDALLFSARFLLLSNFPKRVVGICDKMLWSGIPDDMIYPLLIRAYRDLGRDEDARIAEEDFRLHVSRRTRK